MNLAENKFWSDPFNRDVELEPVIEEFHSNEGSQMVRTGYRVKVSNRLTKAEMDAVCRLLDERLAGGADDLKDALGCSIREAEKLIKLASSATTKLSNLLE